MPHSMLKVMVILDHYQSADTKMSRYYQQLLFLTKCLIAFKFTQNFPSFINGTHFVWSLWRFYLIWSMIMLSQIDKLATSHITTNFKIYLNFFRYRRSVHLLMLSDFATIKYGEKKQKWKNRKKEMPTTKS